MCLQKFFLLSLLSQGLRIVIARYSKGLGGTCSFPDFVWSVPPDGTDRLWLTEFKYSSNSPIWESRRKILAREGVIAFHVQYPWNCDESHIEEDGTCVKSDFRYTIECMRIEGVHTYRVAKRGQGFTNFMCMKFVRRNANIMQVWYSEPSDTNQEDLCVEDNLRRDEWPWIVDGPLKWEACPYVGGYDFHSFLDERRKPLCHRVWRPSRLESECILGEGLLFLFPEKSCSIFHDRALESRLYCWGSWQEFDFTYVVAGQPGSHPRYVLRFPVDSYVAKMSINVYFSPLCPETEESVPRRIVMYNRLEMQRSEPGTCYDESNSCSKFSQEGRCRNGNLHHYGNHCKRSCGLCELVPSDNAECEFPLLYRGEWLLFERDRREYVTINSGQITFSQLGTFVCKAKHWSRNMYKFISVYENGCRPRYTCIEFSHNQEDNYLMFRISKSSYVDTSIKLCEFSEDVQPLGDRVRSTTMKLLFPVTRSTTDSCGLGGIVHMQSSFEDGRTCQGSLTDWNLLTCSFTSKLSLSYRKCSDGLPQRHREFLCEAFIKLPQTMGLLFTREHGENRETTYQCWLVSLSSNRTNIKPKGTFWKQASVLDRTHCGVDGSLDSVMYKPAQATFQIRTEPSETHCLEISKGATSHSSTIRYTVRKSTKDIRASRKRPQTDYIKQNGRAARANSGTPVLFISSVLLLLNFH